MHKTLDTLCKRSFIPAFLLIVFALLPTPAGSEPPERQGREGLQRGHGYGDHTVQQRWATENYRGKRGKNYETLSPEEKSRLNKRIEKWKALPPEEQNELRQRMEEWKRLPSQDRRLYEKRFHQMQELSPGERQRVKEKLRKWDSLSPREKEEIRGKFNSQQGR